MRRRDVLALLAAGGAVAAGAFFGLIGGTSVVAQRARRAPADLLARMRRRTRPLRPEQLGIGEELAG